MTFRQIIRPGDANDVPPHEHDATEVSGTFNVIRLLNAIISGEITSSNFVAGTSGYKLFRTGTAQFNGDTFEVGYLTVMPGSVLDEGGEIALLGYGSNPNWFIDVFEDDLRFRNEASGTAMIFRIAGTEIARFTASGIERAGEPAYLLKETVYYTSDGTWTKADYPGIRAVRVRCQAAGGGGGGAAITAAGQGSAGSGGGGGGYTEALVLAASLGATEAVTVGTGGAGNSGAAGDTGEDSSFGAHAVTTGGLGGATLTASGNNGFQPGGAGGGVSTGDVSFLSSPGSPGLRTASTSIGGNGGPSHLGGGGGGTTNATGGAGRIYGGGGGGAGNNPSQAGALTGGAGGAGIIIVEVYV
jgi:hypothetical protein